MNKYLFKTLFLYAFATLFYIDCGGVFEQEKQNESELFLQGIIITRSVNPIVDCRTNSGFWVRNISTNSSECIGAEKMVERENIILYKELGLNTSLDFSQVAEDFETKIHPALVSAFGEPTDTNQNGKVEVFVLDIRDNATPSGPFVAGFFDPIDFFSDNSNSSVRSNEREILYMDGKELVALLAKDPLAFGSTLAHEYQHLIRYPKMRESQLQDHIWINEGFSEVASDIGGFGPQTHRVRCFMGTADSPCSGGGNSVSLLEWTTGSPGDSSYILKQYSYAYSFIRYLYDSSNNHAGSKNEFFYKSVNGNQDGLRGNDIENLMKLFRETTNHTSNLSYPDNPLGADSQEAFQILLNGFWGQIIAGSNLETVSRSEQVSVWDMSSTKTQFPLKDNTGLFSAGGFPGQSTIPEKLQASSAVVLNTDYSSNVRSVTGTNRLTAIPNNSGSTLLFAESNRNLVIETSQNQVKNLDWNEFQKNHTHSQSFPRGFPDGTQQIPVCGHPFLPVMNEKK